MKNKFRMLVCARLWCALLMTVLGVFSSSAIAQSADSDGDGVPDAMEAAEGLSPTVKDNDIFNVNRLFVMQQYRDLMGREANAPEINSGVSQLNQGTTRAAQIEALMDASEYNDIAGPVVRLYAAYFLRNPDYDGQMFWMNQYRGRPASGWSFEGISEFFSSSPEFKQRYGSLNNDDFVRLIYRNVLSRDAEPSGFTFWTSELNSGRRTRGNVMAAFSESPENKLLKAAEVRAIAIYTALLKRAPTPAEFANAVTQIKAGTPSRTVISAVMAHAEYRDRFMSRAGGSTGGGIPANAKRWSDPATWGGAVPAAGADVTIPAGLNILLDTNANVGGLSVAGGLYVDEKDVNLNAKWIVVSGTFKIGSPSKPFAQRATITLTATDTNENIMTMGTRGILVMGGRLEMHGAVPNVTWTQLSDHAADGAGTLSLKDTVNWKTGDKVVIAPTDFYNDGAFVKTPETEALTVASATGGTVNLQAPLAKFRWGKLQYATESGMSLTQGAITLPNTGGKRVPTVLDQRAEVGNITRNIVIQGADDSLWQTQGFGAHIMIMDRASVVELNGIELRRVGQAGKFGRYPVHFHNLSYAPTGAELGDVAHAVRNSSIWNSSQRCLVVHGTNGVTLANNICYDIRGHGIFLEDAVERRNLIEKNLIVKVRRPANPLLKHEGPDGFGGTSSAMWITNPDNTVRGNVAADVIGHGYWLAFPQKTLGSNKQVNMNGVNARPDRMPFGVFEDNVAHSVGQNGVFLDGVPRDSEVGETEGNKYMPMVNGADAGYDFTKWLRFTLARVTTYKAGAYWGGGGGIWNRNTWPDFVEWVSADHMGTWFAGAGDFGLIGRSLVVGTSLNNRTTRPTSHPALGAIASYHSTFDITQNVIVNFPFEEKENQPSGAFRTNDYYLIGVDKGLIRNPDNKLIGTHPGYRVLPPALSPYAKPNENYTFSGALWDPHGYWGPKNNYWVYDVPFLTAKTNTSGIVAANGCVAVVPAGKNGMSCDSEYYGVDDFLTDFDTKRYSFDSPVDVSRRDPANIGAEIGKWTVADGAVSVLLPNMRHFSARTGGAYVLRFPKRAGGGYDLPKSVQMNVSNAWRASDWFILAVSFDGAVNPSQVYLTTWYSREQPRTWDNSNPNIARKRTMLPTTNLTNVIADPEGDLYWRDTANNLVWVKVRGGLPNPDHDREIIANPKSDFALYGSTSLAIYGP